MRFMIIRKADKKTEAGVLPPRELVGVMGQYNQTLAAAGGVFDGAGLKPSVHGKRVRLAAGKVTVTDGPFSEAKELVGGFSIFEAPTRAAAIELLRRWPTLDGDGDVDLELRQVYEMSDFPVDPSEKPGGWRDQEEAARAQLDAGKAPTPPPRKPGTKRYMIALRADRQTESGELPKPEAFERMGALMEEAVKSGAMLGGEGLKPSRLGARATMRDGKVTVVDGPFTETKELIAGYTLLQTATIDEAVDFAKRWLRIHVEVSGESEGQIEVRPLYEMEDFASLLA